MVLGDVVDLHGYESRVQMRMLVAVALMALLVLTISILYTPYVNYQVETNESQF